MKRILTIGTIAIAQLALVGIGVAPQLSARLAGDSYLLRVAPVDPIDPFRGAYVALSYPDLQRNGDQQPWSEDLGQLDDEQRGDLYLTLRQEGEVWVAGEWSRQRPDETPYLACDDRDWRIRCGIESWFVPQDEAAAMEESLGDGAYAELRIDGRGNAAVVDVREQP